MQSRPLLGIEFYIDFSEGFPLEKKCRSTPAHNQGEFLIERRAVWLTLSVSIVAGGPRILLIETLDRHAEAKFVRNRIRSHAAPEYPVF